MKKVDIYAFYPNGNGERERETDRKMSLLCDNLRHFYAYRKYAK